MSRRAFDTEITLDLAVNMIPLAIISFFVVLFAVFNPWGFALVHSTVQFAVLLSMIVLLGFVTYVSARVIETDDRTHGETPKPGLTEDGNGGAKTDTEAESR